MRTRTDQHEAAELNELNMDPTFTLKSEQFQVSPVQHHQKYTLPFPTTSLKHFSLKFGRMCLLNLVGVKGKYFPAMKSEPVSLLGNLQNLPDSQSFHRIVWLRIHRVVSVFKHFNIDSYSKEYITETYTMTRIIRKPFVWSSKLKTAPKVLCLGLATLARDSTRRISLQDSDFSFRQNILKLGIGFRSACAWYDLKNCDVLRN